jgi:hypothetical protein
LSGARSPAIKSGGTVRDNADMNRAIAAQRALGQVGLAEEIGAAVVALLAGETAGLNGQRVEVSGGMFSYEADRAWRTHGAMPVQFRLARNHSDYEDDDDGADRGVDDVADQPTPDVEANSRKQPACHHRADDAEHNVSNQAEAAALHDLSGQPARDSADNEPNKNSLWIHDRSSGLT